MREESRTPTSHNPGKPECQEKASSGGDSRCVDCCDIAGLLPGRRIERQIGTLGRSFVHLRKSEKAGAPQKRIEGVIQHNGITVEISTLSIQKVHESNIGFRYVKVEFDNTNGDLRFIRAGKLLELCNPGAKAGRDSEMFCLKRAMSMIISLTHVPAF